MAVVESESLILKSYSLGEADKIVVFLTQDHGLIRGVANGARRLKSRFGGLLEPFSIVNLTYYQKEERELVSINSIELQKSYFIDAVRPEFLQTFAYFSDLLTQFAPPNDPNVRLYRMAKVCLETASNEPQNLKKIAFYFEIWMLRLAGYLPNWKNCHSCQREFLPTEISTLQTDFHLLCGNCQKSNNGKSILPQERHIFFLAQKISPTKFNEQTLENAEEVQKISKIMKQIISHILGKESIGEKILIAKR